MTEAALAAPRRATAGPPPGSFRGFQACRAALPAIILGLPRPAAGCRSCGTEARVRALRIQHPQTSMATAKKSEAKKPNPALMKPVQPDEVLAAVVGSKPMPRSEITKLLWDYIKKNGLQDAKNKRNINADAKLKAVFGGKAVVSMFEMTKLVSAHMKSI